MSEIAEPKFVLHDGDERIPVKATRVDGGFSVELPEDWTATGPVVIEVVADLDLDERSQTITLVRLKDT